MLFLSRFWTTVSASSLLHTRRLSSSNHSNPNKGIKKKSTTTQQWKCFCEESFHISGWINWQLSGWAPRPKTGLTFCFYFFLFFPCQWYNISADVLKAQTFLAAICQSLGFHGCWLWVLNQHREVKKRNREILSLWILYQNSNYVLKPQPSGKVEFLSMDRLIAPQKAAPGSIVDFKHSRCVTTGW